MMLRACPTSNRRRRGALLVESALVYPVLFMVIFAIIMLSLAVFRHHQVNHIAAEAARYAAVHGAQNAREGGTATTATDVFDKVIKPHAAAMNLNDLAYTVVWSPSQEQKTSMPSSDGQQMETISNTVTVTITYTYRTGIFGTYTMKNTAVMPVAF